MEHPVGLRFAEEGVARGRDRVERRLHMGEIHQRGPTPGKNKCESVSADEAIRGGFGARPLCQCLPLWLLRFIDALEHDHRRAVDGTIRMLATGETRLPGQRRIPGRVDKACGGKFYVAITGGEIEFANSAAVARHTAQDRAEQHGNIGDAYRLFDQRDRATSSYMTTVVFDGPPRR